MAQTRPCDVRPQSDQDKYSIALMDRSGKWWGFDVPLSQIYPSTTNPPEPLERVSINSFHAGRGFDKFVPDQFGYYDSYNGWSTTPGKFHATLLQKWGQGLVVTGINMPNDRGVHWRPLVGSSRFLSATFAPGSAFTGAQLTLLIRRAVPAGTVGAPGTLTVQVCADSGGKPGAVLTSKTVTSNDITDVISTYHTWAINVSFAASTYHIKVFGSASDKKGACWEVGCHPARSGFVSSNGSTWNPTTVTPYFKVDGSIPKRQFKPFIFDGALYLIGIYDDGTTPSSLYINGVRGRAAGAQSATALQDTGHGAYGATAWPTNRFAGSFVRIIRGTGQGQVRQITGNNGTQLFVDPPFDITPVDGSSEYVVYASDYFFPISGTDLGVVTGAPVIQNGIVYFPHGDGSSVIRKMRLNYDAPDDHEFGTEGNPNWNKAYFLEAGFDTAKGEPVIWRANQRATSGSAPNGKAVSVAKASTAPNRVPVAWTGLLSFAESILTGDNTNLITNIHFHEGALYVMKEDGLYIVQNDQAVQVRMGVENAPDIDNGRAAVTAGDKNLYVAFRNDVYMITGGGAYSTGLKNNLPAERSGPVHSLIAAEGWVFAAINGGTNNYSSVMKFSLDTRTWSEQWRANRKGARIRNLQWQPCPETRPRLWIDYEGEMVYQEFPINGVRPYDDKQIKYQHEAVLELPTIDLGTTDPKYFAVLTVTSQGLAQEVDLEKNHMIVVECQTDNDVGTAKWEHVDYIKTSPTGRVVIGRGSKRMIRIRLRLISNEPKDPVIVETVSLSLFARKRLGHEWTMQFPLLGDDEEQNSVDVLMWLRQAAQTAEPLTMYSRFTLFDNRQVTIADEPRYNIAELDQPNNEMEAQVWLKLTEVI